MALLYGDFETLLLKDQAYAYCRTYFDQLVIVIMNKSKSAKKITFDLPERFENFTFETHFGSKTGVKDGILTIELEAGSFDVCTNN